MKNFIFILAGALSFVGCGGDDSSDPSAFIVKNEMGKTIKAGDTLVKSGECKEVSDFPLTFQTENGGPLSEGADIKSEYTAGHYVVHSSGRPVPQDDRPECKKKPANSENSAGNSGQSSLTAGGIRADEEQEGEAPSGASSGSLEETNVGWFCRNFGWRCDRPRKKASDEQSSF